MTASFITLEALHSYNRAGRALILDYGGPRVAITVLTDRMIRVRLAPEGTFAARRSWAVARADDEFPEAAFAIEESGQALVLRTASLALRIERMRGSLSFANAQGQPFCADEAGMQWGRAASGPRRVACAKHIEAGEHFFGFGERTGQLDKLGRQLINWTTDPAHGHGPGTDPLYLAIPVFLALRPAPAYGVFFNNTWRSRFDIGARRPGVWLMEAEGGELDYYVVYGPRVEAICREFLRLRYRLLPYLYTLFWEAARRGTPVLRPLLYHFPDDPATYQLHDQVLLGPQLLAAPIYHPGSKHRHVYLPTGAWYDWWSDEVIAGPTHLLAYAPLERMPLYVRSGAIIPGGPDMRYADERPLDPLTLDLYPGNGVFKLYEDDGHSFEYEHGQFSATSYTLRRTEDRLVFEIGGREGAYVPPARRLLIRVRAVDEQAAEGHPGASYDPDRRLLTLLVDDDGNPRAMSFKLSV